MTSEIKITPRQEAFINYILEGYTLKESYYKSFPHAKERTPSTVYSASVRLFHTPAIQARYIELKAELAQTLQEKVMWSRQQSIELLLNVIHKNRIESDRYEQAYNDEMEMLDRRIKSKIDELNNPKGYQSKKSKANLQAEIDALKLNRIACNRRHQSNKAVNEAIINSVDKLNIMMGYYDSVNNSSAGQIIFINDLEKD